MVIIFHLGNFAFPHKTGENAKLNPKELAFNGWKDAMELCKVVKESFSLLLGVQKGDNPLQLTLGYQIKNSTKALD